MSKKDKRRATDNSRSFLTDDENISDSPFKNIVLKEKTEEEKKVKKTPPKKPSQIVQGYDPNASFKDILYNWEHTGNPYALPSKGKKEEIKAKETSFADIFAKWEKQNDKSKKSSKQEVKRVSPEYKPTKDFGSLLDQFEGKPQKKQSNNADVKIEKQVVVDKPTFFKEKEEDDERPSTVAWSVFGDNKPIKREEKIVEVEKEKKEKEVKRVSPEYKPTKDFGTLLNSFEGGIKPKKEKIVEKEEKKVIKKEELPEKPTFFKEKEDDDERPSTVAWSVFGDNKPIIREEKKVKEKEERKEEVKRVSPEYKPTKDFGTLLNSFEGGIKPKKVEKEEVVKKEEELPEKPTFFKEKEEDDERPSSVSWSVFGDNKPNIREEKKVEVKEEKKETEVKRVSPEYKPTKDFGTLLNSFEGGIKPKKEDDREKKVIKEEELPEKPTFFKEKEDDDERPSIVAWSVFGDNKPIVREEKIVEIKQEEITPSIEPVVIKKAPVKKSKLFNESVNKIPQKSFEEILKEKGEVKKKQREKTLNELRVMLPMATLDLHGMTYVEAENEINNFINEAISSKIQKIAIIHGKGLHSEDGVGVLKDLVYKILNDRNVAREITIPKPQYGGSGAVWVILKKEEEAQ